MANKTGISWTDSTWNPWHGCIKVGPGCKNCYMYSDKARYGQDPTTVTKSQKGTFNAPLKWKEPKKVFTCSWSDFFIEHADDWRDEAWDIIRNTPHLTYQILTKRPERIMQSLPDDWGDGYENVWLGVSCEDREYGIPRVGILQTIPAKCRFISFEPLLEDVGDIDLRGIHWVIIGGESGHGFRAMEKRWAENIIRVADGHDIDVWFKQWGGTSRDKGGHIINGIELQQFPQLDKEASC